MDRDYGFCIVADIVFYFGWIKAKSRRVDVDENGSRAHAPNRTGGGKERETRDDDFIAGLQVERHHRQQQRIRTGSATDREFGLAKHRHLLFKFRATWARDKFSGTADFLNCRDNLRVQNPVSSVDIQHRNRVYG